MSEVDKIKELIGKLSDDDKKKLFEEPAGEEEQRDAFTKDELEAWIKATVTEAMKNQPKSQPAQYDPNTRKDKPQTWKVLK